MALLALGVVWFIVIGALVLGTALLAEAIFGPPILGDLFPATTAGLVFNPTVSAKIRVVRGHQMTGWATHNGLLF